MRRLLLVPLLLLFSAACATRPDGRADSAASAPVYSPPAQPPIGRIISVDTRNGFAVTALNPDGEKLFRAEHREFHSRRADLTPTARLLGTVHRHGATLGLRILEGLPSPGDEVVPAPPPVVPPPAP